MDSPESGVDKTAGLSDTAKARPRGQKKATSLAVPFVLAFSPSKIAELASRYRGYDDEIVFEAGRRITAGNFGVAELRTIFEWKTRGRGRSRLERNAPEEIQDALRLALSARTERSAISVFKRTCRSGRAGRFSDHDRHRSRSVHYPGFSRALFVRRGA
jgi:hypothetical protein